MYNNLLQAYRAATPEYVSKQNDDVVSLHSETVRAEIFARLNDDTLLMEAAISEVVRMIEDDIKLYSQCGGATMPPSAMKLVKVMRKEEARACRLIEGEVRDNNITVADAIRLLEKIGHIVFEAESRITASLDPTHLQTVS